MSIVERHLEELTDAFWLALPDRLAALRDLLASDPDAFFLAVRQAMDWRDAWSMIALGRVLQESNALRGPDAHRMSFATRLGEALLTQHRFAEALAALQDARLAEDAGHKYWSHLARALAGVGRLDEAHASVCRALVLRPNFEEGRKLREVLESTIALQRIDAGAGLDWTGLRRLAEGYVELGLLAPARVLLTRAVQHPPAGANDLRRDLISVLEAAAELIDPADVLALDVVLKPETRISDRLAALRVRCMVRQGRAAATCSTHAETSGGPDLHLQLALACAEAGDLDAAIRRLGRLSLDWPQNNEIRNTLAWCVGRDVLGRTAVEPGPAAGRRRIFNLVTFNDELTMLELRLAEMADWVDHIVIVEAGQTFTGAPKPLHFRDNAARFSAYGAKLLHVAIDRFPDHVDSPWARDFHQRDMAIAALCGRAGPEDLVLLTDADEIVDRRALGSFDGEFACLKMGLFRYFLNYRPTSDAQPQRRTAAVWKAGHLQRFGSSYARFGLSRFPGAGAVIERSGWHFTSVLDPAAIVAKVNSYAHQEREDLWRDEVLVADRLDQIRRGEGDPGWERCVIDDSFPRYVRDNAAALADLIL